MNNKIGTYLCKFIRTLASLANAFLSAYKKMWILFTIIINCYKKLLSNDIKTYKRNFILHFVSG